MIGHTDIIPALPKIKHTHKLPTILSQEECQLLFDSALNFKHKVILKIIYAAGLRAKELTNLTVDDMDFERKLIHIRSGKGGKDRYVPLPQSLLDDLLFYFQKYKPRGFLFYSGLSIQYKTGGLRHILSAVKRKAKISKNGVCLHTLRHSFAVHLLENGVDIVSIKNMMGHSNIQTTMIYLQTVNFDSKKRQSPLDYLYPVPDFEKISKISIELSKIKREREMAYSRNNSSHQTAIFEFC